MLRVWKLDVKNDPDRLVQHGLVANRSRSDAFTPPYSPPTSPNTPGGLQRARKRDGGDSAFMVTVARATEAKTKFISPFYKNIIYIISRARQ